MILNFNDDRTYSKDVVLANVRYALFDPKTLRDDVVSAEFLDLAVVFAIVDTSNPYRTRYKIIDAIDMISLDIKLSEIMEAANENCKKTGYKIMLMEDAYPRLLESQPHVMRFIQCMLGQIPNAYSVLPFCYMRHISKILRCR